MQIYRINNYNKQQIYNNQVFMKKILYLIMINLIILLTIHKNKLEIIRIIYKIYNPIK